MKFPGQIKCRLLKEEAIAAEEKIYFMFDEHPEWISTLSKIICLQVSNTCGRETCVRLGEFKIIKE